MVKIFSLKQRMWKFLRLYNMGQTFVFNTGNSKASVDELHLQFGMFFDGTLNNMKYTEPKGKE